MLRTPEEKSEILSRLQPSESIAGVVSSDVRQMLLDVYHNSPDKIEKNTGPTVLDYDPNKNGWPEWARTVDELITPYIGEHQIYFANFFDVTYPHRIHNDDSIKKKPRMHKNCVIPLWIEGAEHTHFATFDQCYLDGPVKVVHGADKQKIMASTKYYNEPLTDTAELEYYTGKDFDQVLWEKYFTHQGLNRFHGLSVEGMLKWQPGNLLIFDGARIHCAADFRKVGVTRKIGLSVFTCI